MLNLVLALLAGVVTVVAPCTLPMLPILLGASVGRTGKARPAMIALGFVISFSAAALLLSAAIDLFDLDPNILRTGAAVLLLGFGVLMIWPTPFERLTAGVGGIAYSTAGNNPARDNAKDFERLALWEIHPIYAIDVCKFADKTKCEAASAWIPFSELKTLLCLSSVTPTEKCKAVTDNPNSKCPGFKPN